MYKISREDNEFIDSFRDDISCPALYILLNNQNKQAYIGETDNFLTRLNQHTSQKNFWSYALAFVATDGSLTTTEVRYLEAKAYELAKCKNNYDLKENGQIPRSPYIQRLQKLKADDFFENAKCLCRFIGCDIFDFSQNPVSYTNPEQEGRSILKPLPIPESPDELKGKIKIQINSFAPCSKGLVPFLVVKEFISQHPRSTFQELQNIFRREYLQRWSMYQFLESDLAKARSCQENEGRGRYCCKEEQVLVSGDGVRFVVCNQWDRQNIVNILGLVKTFGWTYKILK